MIDLAQINTVSNIKDGAPSTLLDCIPISTNRFGELVTLTRERPCFKLLRNGLINELSVRILDEKGVQIDNNNQSITVILEINKHVYTRRAYCLQL